MKLQLAALDHQAQAANREAKARLTAQVAELETLLSAAEDRLAELTSVRAESWREAQAGFSQEMRDLKQACARHTRERSQG